MIAETFKKLAGVAWFLPGFLLWAAFPPLGEGADCLFALAPLMWLSRRGQVGVSTRRWFANGAFFWVATLSWMPAIVKNGGPWPLVVLGWFALSAYCAGYFALYGWLSSVYWRWARGADAGAPWRRLLGFLVVEPVLWCGLELVRSRLLGGFAWNQLGVVPANLGFGGPAALGGVYLLSAAVVLVNGTFAGIFERAWRVERSGFPALRKFGPLETLLAFALVFGVYAAARGCADARDAGGGAAGDERQHLKVALVQRNFPCVFQAKEENPLSVYSNLLQGVSALKPDLVVLSESAMSEFGAADGPRARRFAELVREQTGGAALFAGGTRVEGGRMFNSAALYDGDKLEVYDKVHLVPFGEFIPGDKWFPALQKLAPVGSCTPGFPRLLAFGDRPHNIGDRPHNAAAEIVQNDAKTSQNGYNAGVCPQLGVGDRPQTAGDRPQVMLGAAICFEDTDSALMRRYAAMGARALVFITNDSWFSNSGEALAHAWQATARAVETGLPVVRVGNSGVTGTISPTGRATWMLGPEGRPLVDRRGAMFDRVPLAPADSVPTPYVRFGDAPLFAAFALLVAAMGSVAFAARRRTRWLDLSDEGGVLEEDDAEGGKEEEE